MANRAVQGVNRDEAPMESMRLTRGEIRRLVHNWIGVHDGYLGHFGYASHDRFWLEVCDRFVDTTGFAGTTRACFETTLFEVDTNEQAAVLRAILDEYPRDDEPDPDRPTFRSSELHRAILAWISRLETGQIAVEVEIESPSDIVRRALDDAASLLRTTGPQSAVDRVHTALHGYLRSLCEEIDVHLDGRPTMNQLFKALRGSHPALADVGTRAEDVKRILGAMATILDALNPVRNRGSVAHPNDQLIGEPEAHLVINVVRTLLNYLEDKRRRS